MAEESRRSLVRRKPSRAVAALAAAAVSHCPHCGRDSKTVSGGVCADCWGVKDPEHALDFRPEPKTEPLFDLSGWLGDWVPVGAVMAMLLAGVGLLIALFAALR